MKHFERGTGCFLQRGYHILADRHAAHTKYALLGRHWRSYGHVHVLCECDRLLWQCQKIEKYIYRSDVHVTFELNGHFMFTGPLFKIKLHLPNTAPRELWNPLSNGVPCKFHGTGGHRKLKTQLFTTSSQFSQVSGMANCPNFNTGYGLCSVDGSKCDPDESTRLQCAHIVHTSLVFLDAMQTKLL